MQGEILLCRDLPDKYHQLFQGSFFKCMFGNLLPRKIIAFIPQLASTFCPSSGSDHSSMHYNCIDIVLSEHESSFTGITLSIYISFS